MKKQYITRLFGRLAVCGVLLATIACTGNFEQYNTKPYRPGDGDLEGDNVGVGILFPAMMGFIAHMQVNDAQMNDVLLGDEFGGYAAAAKWNSFSSGQAFSTWNPADKFNDALFRSAMTSIYGNYYKVIERTGGEGPVFALATIIRVGAMLKVTDAYGAIPYSQMQKGSFTVAYDTQKEVYFHMIDDLDTAMELLHKTVSAGSSTLLSEFDLSSFRGDLKGWLSYANMLKLRMAIRMSGVVEVKTDAERIYKEAIAAKATYGLIDENTENMSFMAVASRNPYYVQATDTSWKDLRSNASITMYMGLLNDPRCGKYFSQSGYEDAAYVGLYPGVQNMTPEFAEKYSYPAFAEDAPVPVMYAAECWFLRAEGALLGWDVEDTAANFYARGVRTSFDQWKVSEELTAYLEQAEPVSLSYTDPEGKYSKSFDNQAVAVAWDEGATDAQKLERIITQKWIANHMIGHEAWADFRRTGYPHLIMARDNLSTTNDIRWGRVDAKLGMRRLHYPQAEYDNNGENVNAAVAAQGGVDGYAVDVWWAKK